MKILFLFLFISCTISVQDNVCILSTLIHTENQCDKLVVKENNINTGMVLLDNAVHMFSELNSVNFIDYSIFIFENYGFIQTNFSLYLSNIFIIDVQEEEGYRELISVDSNLEIIPADIFVHFTKNKKCVQKYEFKQKEKNILGINITFYSWCAKSKISVLKLILLISLGCGIIFILLFIVIALHYGISRKNQYEYLK